MMIVAATMWDQFGLTDYVQDYLGEFEVQLEEIFTNGLVSQEVRHPHYGPWRGTLLTPWNEQPRWFNLQSKRKNAKISGEVLLQLSIFDSVALDATPEQILSKWYPLISYTPSPEDEHQLGQEDQDQDDVDDDDLEGEVEDISDETDLTDAAGGVADTPEKKKKRLRLAKLRKKRKTRAQAYELSGGSDVVGVVFLEIKKITDLPPERNSKT
jgi:phosphatidylserine decarboxylase